MGWAADLLGISVSKGSQRSTASYMYVYPERSTEIVRINQVVLRLIWFIMAPQSTYVQG
jgi:hypothetical protein